MSKSATTKTSKGSARVIRTSGKKASVSRKVMRRAVSRASKKSA
ncbi:MAG: hypothetical protein WD757_06930 [Actinomycetota bacterium]